jgi:hypothetical protein
MQKKASQMARLKTRSTYNSRAAKCHGRIKFVSSFANNSHPLDHDMGQNHLRELPS